MTARCCCRARAREQPAFGNLALDETIGTDRYNTASAPAETELNNGDAPNGTPDDSGVATVTVSTSPGQANAIGELTTAAGAISGLFPVYVPDFGTDGPGPNDGYSQELSFELSGDQIPTNLRVTALDNTPLENLNAAARAIVLVQVNDTTIEGRIVGDGNPGTADQYVAFRITLNNANDPATATITVDRFLPIDHGADQVSAFDEVTTLLTSGDGTLVLHQVTTITDGDTDTIVQDDTVNLLANENSFISFDDDGPLVSAQANAAFSINHDETLLLQATNDILFTSVFTALPIRAMTRTFR